MYPLNLVVTPNWPPKCGRQRTIHRHWHYDVPSLYLTPIIGIRPVSVTSKKANEALNSQLCIHSSTAWNRRRREGVNSLTHLKRAEQTDRQEETVFPPLILLIPCSSICLTKPTARLYCLFVEARGGSKRTEIGEYSSASLFYFCWCCKTKQKTWDRIKQRGTCQTVETSFLHVLSRKY